MYDINQFSGNNMRFAPIKILAFVTLLGACETAPAANTRKAIIGVFEQGTMQLVRQKLRETCNQFGGRIRDDTTVSFGCKLDLSRNGGPKAGLFGFVIELQNNMIVVQGQIFGKDDTGEYTYFWTGLSGSLRAFLEASGAIRTVIISTI